MHRIPYVKTLWEDHIVDIVDDEVIQEGTRFTASRANNVEDGIFNLYWELLQYREEILRLRIQLEMIGRVPGNNGTFFDPIDEAGTTKALTILEGLGVAQNDLVVGATTIALDDATDFAEGENITIFDDVSSEDKKVISISENEITISALTNSYKKGALVKKTNAVINGSKLDYQTWGNYNIEVKEVI